MTTATGRLTFDSLDPATGAVVGTHPIQDAAAVRAAVTEAGTAAVWWAGLGWAERRRRLLDYKAVITRNLARIAAAVHDETGKPEAAADAALWGALSNAGQTCVGVERVYAVDAVYDDFMGELTRRARKVRAGEDYGPITMPAQLDVIRRHIRDAVAGGRAVLGGPESVRAPFVDVELARRMRGGMTAINSIISFAAVPSLPFGGVGDSGFGRIHGADGLREFSRPKAVSRQRFTLPGMNLTSFTRGQKELDRLVRLVTFLHGRRKR
ncbi:Aldehyde dehydrogenase family protein [Streptosporangium canum]|uniref:Aldehyde dehydrogenase family protein n=1 Tax=Streptosporangium canum TaxID=324952 RepID=A0A1I3ID17_9ACTN|nr:aldehyde dehydrogenase family protein [Streptosporangium canum]SFI45832.1 Aldehyde dehydrogenase family protein [Streptosporangium canum]